MNCEQVSKHIELCPSCRMAARLIGASEFGRKGGSVSSAAKKRAAKLRWKREREEIKRKIGARQ